MVTEGEFKALALWRLANHGSPARPEFLPLGLSGVSNWRGTIEKTVGPEGSRLDVNGSIPDLDCVAWQDRKVVIAYDADAVIKSPVRIARSELAAHLRGRGALVGFLEGECSGIAIDRKDNVWVFNRGKHPVIQYDKNGNLLHAWGEVPWFLRMASASIPTATSGESTSRATS